MNFSSPFAQLALALNLNWLALLLYADAFVSPSGTGMTYTATTARMVYAMEKSGSLPKIFGHIHTASGIPRPAMWLNLCVSFLFLFFLRGWGSLAAVISVATIISYQIGPICVGALRRVAPEMKRPLRTPVIRRVRAGGLRALHPAAVLGPLAADGRGDCARDRGRAHLRLGGVASRLEGLRPATCMAPGG